MLLRGQRLDTFGWVICKCQSLAAIREQAGSNGCILKKARRALSRLRANPQTPRPAAHRPPPRLGLRAAPGRPKRPSSCLISFPLFPSRKQRACQELAGGPSCEEEKVSCGRSHRKVQWGLSVLGQGGLRVFLCEGGIRRLPLKGHSDGRRVLLTDPTESLARGRHALAPRAVPGSEDSAVTSNTPALMELSSWGRQEEQTIDK